MDLTIADNDQVVHVNVGTVVAATLDSTYWEYSAPAGNVLVALGSPVYTPAPAGQCVPGEGCGTVVATYKAGAPGSTNVVASRTVCGEALLCTGNNGAYSVNVVVGG
ncbi:MAG: hypothetical protein ACRDYC_08560 [Acidimicrobiales bacterium]